MVSRRTMLHQGTQVRNVPAAILYNAVSLALAKPLQRLQALGRSVESECFLDKMVETQAIAEDLLHLIENTQRRQRRQ
jgi:hypothetical protein